MRSELPNACRVVCGRAEGQPRRRVAASPSRRRSPRRRSRLSGACRSVDSGGAVGALRRSDAAQADRVAPSGAGCSQPSSRARLARGCSCCASLRPTPPGFPARARGVAQETSAGVVSVSVCPAGSTRLRTRRAASARRRPPSTSPPASPRRRAARSWSTSTRRRTRPPGSAMRANGTSSLRPARRRPLDELARPTRFANLDLVPSKPELAGRRGRARAARRRRALPRRRARGATRRLRRSSSSTARRRSAR